ncbi:MAG: hypothetical protein MK116_01935 [Phycisphaerales bacterium]|nr:hypothetical protein [Phycisphaerales bacterium]
MNRSLLVFLLGLSVLFNVFFIVGAMTWRVSEEDNNSQEIATVVDVLGLDARQADAFRAMRAQYQTEAMVIGEQLRRVRTMLAEELASESPDIYELRRLTELETGLQSERREIGTDQFAHLIDLLSPEQRRTLGHRMMGPHGRRGRHVPPHEMERRALEKFDVNGDGLLDEQERAAAREFARDQHEQRRQRRREAERQFDADGDGKLSPEEQEAFRQHLLEQREDRDGPGRRRPGDRPPPDHRHRDGRPHGDHHPPGSP